mmetsp:Transcript_33227/g.72858  ORF Transcript_33227/g.72858 Transcript_33227/m.72858 type:complete len:97 (+) Transcript_33227:151-441(+)
MCVPSLWCVFHGRDKRRSSLQWNQYLANVMLNMILPHADDSLCKAINEEIVDSKGIKEKFAELAETATIVDEAKSERYSCILVAAMYMRTCGAGGL